MYGLKRCQLRLELITGVRRRFAHRLTQVIQPVARFARQLRAKECLHASECGRHSVRFALPLLTKTSTFTFPAVGDSARRSLCVVLFSREHEAMPPGSKRTKRALLTRGAHCCLRFQGMPRAKDPPILGMRLLCCLLSGTAPLGQTPAAWFSYFICQLFNHLSLY